MTTPRYYVLLIATLLVANADAALVTNGDFEGGNTGFGSDYPFAVLNTVEREYTVGSDPASFNHLFTSFGDHTSGTGLMMVVNGSPNSTDRVWFQDINVTAGQQVDFSFYAANVYAINPATLALDVDGLPVSSFDLAGIGLGNWTRFDATFTPLTTGPVTLSLRDTNTIPSGNDFAIDDIRAVSIPEPSSLVVYGIALLAVVGFRRRKKTKLVAG